MLVWLKDYLNNRKQYVEINGKKSKLLIVEYGVPQGSLFGPRLFSIYLNDLVSKLNNNRRAASLCRRHHCMLSETQWKA